MAWTTPKTWGSGETLTAVVLNNQLRDNLLYVQTRLIALDARTEPAPPSAKSVVAAAAVAVMASPLPLTRRGFFAPWRRK